MLFVKNEQTLEVIVSGFLLLFVMFIGLFSSGAMRFSIRKAYNQIAAFCVCLGFGWMSNSIWHQTDEPTDSYLLEARYVVLAIFTLLFAVILIEIFREAWESMRCSPSWWSLPAELRFECIKRMDFKTRMRFRDTSSRDRQLIDSMPKYRFDTLLLHVDDGIRIAMFQEVSKTVEVGTLEFERRFVNKTPRTVQKARRLLAKLLRFSSVNTLEIGGDFGEDVDDLLQLIYDHHPFRFEYLHLRKLKYGVAKVLLEKWEHPRDLLDINVQGFRWEEMVELCRLESVVEASEVNFRSLRGWDAPYQLVKRWVEEGAEVGKKMLCYSYLNWKEHFTTKLASQILEQTETCIRVRTGNEAVHILIGTGLAGSPHTNLSFVVIPASDQSIID